MQNSTITEIGYNINNNQDADYVINVLKNQLQHYKKQNSQCNNVVTKLKLTPDSLSFATRETFNNFAKLQETSGVNKFDLIEIQLSYLDYANAKYNYQNKINILKIHHENLQQMSSDVCKETETLESEINAAKIILEGFAPISENELQKVKLQIESYENKLLEYIDKYPWLNEPEYNLLSIQEEIKKLYRLQEELNQLKKEIECYDNLKPDIFLAKKQLAKIKNEYDNISKMVVDSDCSK